MRVWVGAPGCAGAPLRARACGCVRVPVRQCASARGREWASVRVCACASGCVSEWVRVSPSPPPPARVKNPQGQAPPPARVKLRASKHPHACASRTPNPSTPTRASSCASQSTCLCTRQVARVQAPACASSMPIIQTDGACVARARRPGAWWRPGVPLAPMHENDKVLARQPANEFCNAGKIDRHSGA